LTSCSSEDWEKPELRKYIYFYWGLLRYETSLVSIREISIDIGAELGWKTLML